MLPAGVRGPTSPPLTGVIPVSAGASPRPGQAPAGQARTPASVPVPAAVVLTLVVLLVVLLVLVFLVVLTVLLAT